MDPLAPEERYARQLAAALAQAATRAPPGWMRPRLPRAIADSMRVARRLLGEQPVQLDAHYLERAPRELVEQQLRGDDARTLLWRPLDAARLPGFSAALDGACALLRAHGFSPRRLLGAESADQLLAARPCALEVAQGTLLACGLPLLGAGAAEREAIARALALPGADPDAILDRHLGQHLLHELLHGRDAATLDVQRDAWDAIEYMLHTNEYRWDAKDIAWHANHLGGPPWLVREAAALWLQARAFPRHVFPEVAGEAVPGVSLFVLAGECLSAALGADALLAALVSPDEEWPARATPRAAALLAIAEWQEWLQRKSAPFAQDALRALDWARLASAARALSLPGPRSAALEPLAALAERARELGPQRAVRELPSLLDAAAAIGWASLPWWQGAIGSEEPRRARTALRALFQDNALAPIFVTRPAELADGKLTLDTASCVVRAARRAQGVFAEPAHWLFPPPLCRALWERGLRKLELRGAERRECDALADALVALASGAGPLDAEWTLDADDLLARAKPSGERQRGEAGASGEGRWTSSPR